jgi:hypothetical protein
MLPDQVQQFLVDLIEQVSDAQTTAPVAKPAPEQVLHRSVADRRVLLVTSANLTQSGVSKNIEAGLLIRGGAAPVRAVEHVDALRSNGLLTQLS